MDVVIKFVILVCVAGANAQQQTEIVFTEDDDSCDSHKWGKQTVQPSPKKLTNQTHFKSSNLQNVEIFIFSVVLFCFFFDKILYSYFL